MLVVVAAVPAEVQFRAAAQAHKDLVEVQQSCVHLDATLVTSAGAAELVVVAVAAAAAAAAVVIAPAAED